MASSYNCAACGRRLPINNDPKSDRYARDKKIHYDHDEHCPLGSFCGHQDCKKVVVDLTKSIRKQEDEMRIHQRDAHVAPVDLTGRDGKCLWKPCFGNKNGKNPETHFDNVEAHVIREQVKFNRQRIKDAETNQGSQ